ncbi:unnamed protein product [Bursaphelenchus okinawaensis]|uniref:Nuclear receptor domain-containing protein n=1 Tax=Bursaphelenchus okinawaensis TaxID=465554 RepID=A0A811KSI3_9BILA|nr:unnamed protein product [Bursaphelenchus okinawaensis]CAG9109693.1 unnamed protein product [Bursaphelenchus okinawaensis]
MSSTPSSVATCSTSNDDTSKLICKICGAASDGPHFGVPSCRACSAFFRRSIVEGRKYKCSHKNDCEVTSDVRNCCRCCRYAKCLQMGMKAHRVQKPRDLNRNITKTNSKSHASDSLILNHIMHPPKIADRLDIGYKRYVIAQEAIYSTMFVENVLKDRKEMIVIPIEKKLKMEMALVPSMYTFLRDYFCTYATIEKEQKLEVIKLFSHAFSFFQAMYLSTVFFSKKPDYIAYTRHDYVDNKKAKERFVNLKNPSEVEKIFEPLKKKAAKTISKAKRLQLNDQEFLCLVGIVLSNELTYRLQLPQAAEEKRRLMSELYESCKENSPTNAMKRFGQLLLLIRDNEEAGAIFKECVFHALLVNDVIRDSTSKFRELSELFV